jgi:hypothetical protein
MARAVWERHPWCRVVMAHAVQVVHLHSRARVAVAPVVRVVRLLVAADEWVALDVSVLPVRAGRTRAVRPLGEGSVALKARTCENVWVMDVGVGLVAHLEPLPLLWMMEIRRCPASVATESAACSEVAREGGTGPCEAKGKGPAQLLAALMPHAR